MAKGKWNLRLVAGVWVAYWILFVIYLVNSRTPDYASSNRTEGEVVEIYDNIIHGTRGSWAVKKCPIVDYYVNSVKYQFVSDKESYLGLYSKGDKVTIIYNAWDPKEACILGLIGYWINISEILIACLILAIITLFITVVPYGYDDRFTAALNK